MNMVGETQFKICVPTLEQLTRISGRGPGHQYFYRAPWKISMNSEGLEWQL